MADKDKNQQRRIKVNESPPKKIARWDDKVRNSHWVVSHLPQEELECLLDAGIDHCKNGIDDQSEACQRFFREGLLISFTNMLMNDAINNWSSQMHKRINANCEKFVQLCVLKLDKDSSLPLLDVLAMVFDPNNKFHTFNAKEVSVPTDGEILDEKPYALSPPDAENPHGQLVDLISKFGNLGGFTVLLSRFQNGQNLTIPVIHALLRPFGLCYELLTVHTIVKYFMPIVERVQEIYSDNLTFEEFNEEAKNASINRDISAIFKVMKSFISRVPKHQEENIKSLEALRLTIILRFLQNFQNIYEFVDDLSLEEFNYFCECFQTRWTTGDEMAREKMLQLMQRLAEDGKSDTIVDQVLSLFWTLAHWDGISTEMMEQALNAHVKVLEFSSSHDRNTHWLGKCIGELEENVKFSLPAIKQIREICSLYEPTVYSDTSRYDFDREDAIDRIENQHCIIALVRNSLASYMDKMRQFVKENPAIDETIVMPGACYNHIIEVQERLNVLRFLLSDGIYWLSMDSAEDIWRCLVEKAVFPSDREACYQWFSQLSDANLKPELIKHFFEQYILQLDPASLLNGGFNLFKRFFTAVNTDEDKLEWEDGIFYMSDVNLIGLDYLWRIVTNSQEEIANHAIELLKGANKNLSPELQLSIPEFQKNFIIECTNRQRVLCDTLTILTRVCNFGDRTDEQRRSKITMETVKLSRVTRVLQEYANECNIGFPTSVTNSQA